MASTTAFLSRLTTITFSSLTQPLLIMFLLSLLILYTIHIAIYRLYLSPLADIPGPRLAALTQWYEFYYEVILHGQYTFKIIELHKQFGPIIRINPWEVHIADPEFNRVLLPTNTNQRRHRTPFFTKQFGADGMFFSLSPLSFPLLVGRIFGRGLEESKATNAGTWLEPENRKYRGY